jgi:hypothetical protein
VPVLSDRLRDAREEGRLGGRLERDGGRDEGREETPSSSEELSSEVRREGGCRSDLDDLCERTEPVFFAYDWDGKGVCRAEGELVLAWLVL